MDILLEAAENFKKLFDIKYDILLGKKGKEVNIIVTFRNIDFHHLAGLQYIKDMPELNRSRDKVFNDICTDSNLRKKIYNSAFFPKIEDRIKALIRLEALLDNEKLVFNYDYKKNKTSKIKADLLIQASDENQVITFIFCEKNQKCNTPAEVYCKSIFHKGNIDYTKYQSRYTVLKMKKISTPANTILKSFVNPNYIEK